MDSETFRIADQFDAFIHQLNDSLFSYGRSRVAPDVAAFTAASHKLGLWIKAQKRELTSDQEKAIMQQIDAVYIDYLRVTKELLARLEVNGDESATIDEYTSMWQESERLVELGQKLTRAHFASKNQILARANRAIGQLRVLVLVSP